MPLEFGRLVKFFNLSRARGTSAVRHLNLFGMSFSLLAFQSDRPRLLCLHAAERLLIS